MLDEHYPAPECELDHDGPWQLLTATILSAQCTDKRVNLTTPALFERFPTAYDMAEAQQEEVEKLVKSTGFYRNKAKNIIGAAQGIVTRHGGEVPQDMDQLLELPGVARKTANVVLGVAFKIPSGVVVDTHVKRITNLLGFTNETSPVKVERDLCELLPPERWIDFSHQIILHGRAICVARRPACDKCPMAEYCPGKRKELFEEKVDR